MYFRAMILGHDCGRARRRDRALRTSPPSRRSTTAANTAVTTTATRTDRPTLSRNPPAGSAGNVDITVTTAGGTSATSVADQFTYVAAPTVSSISPTTGPGAGGTVVTLTGTNWASDTLLYFDGLPSTIVSLDPVKGSSVVQPPPGINNQQAIVTAYNTDGQNSQYVQPSSPVVYSYGKSPVPVIASISPFSLPAGAEATAPASKPAA